MRNSHIYIPSHPANCDVITFPKSTQWCFLVVRVSGNDSVFLWVERWSHEGEMREIRKDSLRHVYLNYENQTGSRALPLQSPKMSREQLCFWKPEFLHSKIRLLGWENRKSFWAFTHPRKHKKTRKAFVFRKQSPITPVLSLTLHNKKKRTKTLTVNIYALFPQGHTDTHQK